MTRSLGTATLAFALGMLAACPAFAEPASPAAPAAPAPDTPVPLQTPEQRDTRHSAYTLPGGQWGFSLGALGIGGGDAFGQLGFGYGIGAGFELNLNLAHAGVGLVNIAAGYHFLDTRYFDLGARIGVWYGHGDWFWILNGPAKELVSNLDVLNVPIGLFASSPVSRRFQFDLGVEYTHAEVFGTLIDTDAAYFDARIGVRKLELSPGVRLFVADNTEIQVSSALPLYAAIPTERSSLREEGEHVENYRRMPFSDVWALELGVRSRFAKGLFGNMRLHYGEVARALYGAPLFPSFQLEWRP